MSGQISGGDFGRDFARRGGDFFGADEVFALDLQRGFAQIERFSQSFRHDARAVFADFEARIDSGNAVKRVDGRQFSDERAFFPHHGQHQFFSGGFGAVNPQKVGNRTLVAPDLMRFLNRRGDGGRAAEFFE